MFHNSDFLIPEMKKKYFFPNIFLWVTSGCQNLTSFTRVELSSPPAIHQCSSKSRTFSHLKIKALKNVSLTRVYRELFIKISQKHATQTRLSGLKSPTSRVPFLIAIKYGFYVHFLIIIDILSTF